MMNMFTPRSLCKLAALSQGVTMPDDDEADFVLWEQTAFPVCGVAEWVRQSFDFFGAARAHSTETGTRE